MIYTVKYICLVSIFEMATKYIIIRDDSLDKNIICSYTNDTMTTKHLRNIVHKFCDREEDDIFDVTLNSQVKYGANIDNFRFIDDIFEETKKDSHYKDYSLIPDHLQDQIIKLSLSYKSRQRQLERMKEIKRIEKNIKREKKEIEKILSKQENESNEKMVVYCKTHSGRILPVIVSKTDTIITIKEKILALEGTPFDQPRIIFAGRQLDEDNSLESYNIQHKSTIHFILRLKGGMFLQITSGNFDYNNIGDIDINLDDTI
jgi:ubiquitin-large subunit ribosomal protein L40e